MTTRACAKLNTCHGLSPRPLTALAGEGGIVPISSRRKPRHRVTRPAVRYTQSYSAGRKLS